MVTTHEVRSGVDARNQNVEAPHDNDAAAAHDALPPLFVGAAGRAEPTPTGITYILSQFALSYGLRSRPELAERLGLQRVDDYFNRPHIPASVVSLRAIAAIDGWKGPGTPSGYTRLIDDGWDVPADLSGADATPPAQRAARLHGSIRDHVVGLMQARLKHDADAAYSRGKLTRSDHAEVLRRIDRREFPARVTATIERRVSERFRTERERGISDIKVWRPAGKSRMLTPVLPGEPIVQKHLTRDLSVSALLSTADIHGFDTTSPRGWQSDMAAAFCWRMRTVIEWSYGRNPHPRLCFLLLASRLLLADSALALTPGGEHFDFSRSGRPGVRYSLPARRYRRRRKQTETEAADVVRYWTPRRAAARRLAAARRKAGA